MIDYKKIQELDVEYEDIIGAICMEGLGANESQKGRLDAIKSELRELDKFGISTIIDSLDYY